MWKFPSDKIQSHWVGRILAVKLVYNSPKDFVAVCGDSAGNVFAFTVFHHRFASAHRRFLLGYAEVTLRSGDASFDCDLPVVRCKGATYLDRLVRYLLAALGYAELESHILAVVKREHKAVRLEDGHILGIAVADETELGEHLIEFLAVLQRAVIFLLDLGFLGSDEVFNLAADDFRIHILDYDGVLAVTGVVVERDADCMVAVGFGYGHTDGSLKFHLRILETNREALILVDKDAPVLGKLVVNLLLVWV